MILYPRSSGLALVFSVMMLGVAGCAEDNEAAVRAQANAPVPDSVKNIPPPKTQEEAFKRAQQNNSATKANGYPGAK
jgi:hypothetical protein